ncbi:MAG TPA: glycosyltransferase family A protein [Stellaceae bacterium]|nr:glycosyltransferase family A protein [Stellaceae bacterium]
MAQSSSARPVVSLVICTRNRARQLRACLAAVGKIDCRQSWEVIIVDNGSHDDTQAVAEAFLRHQAVRGRCIVEPQPGVSRAKNTGIAASRGAIIAFTDDDCYPAADFLDRICDIFADRRIGFIGGRILLHDPTDYPLTVNESVETVRFAARHVVPNAAIQGANMAFRREALTGVGGFDVALGPGTPFTGEDWDVVARVCMDGWAGGYFPGPTVSHHHGRKAHEAAQQLRSYHYGSGAVFAKLVITPQTRWAYGRHWARRILGDSKHHHRKLLHQFRGALDYWRQARRGSAAREWPAGSLKPQREPKPW